MQDNNLNILKQFSRKLANCKYRVPVDKLCQYFNEGQFGYTTIKGSDTVVTNDFVFADDISTAIKHIRAIFSEPHISLRQENVIKNASMSSNVDARALSSTIKDEKLWKVNGNSIRPEYVHAYVQEDNLAIYENRFISFLIDTLFNVANEKLGSLCDNIKNINSEMKSAFPLSEDNDYSVNDYVDFLDYNNGLPVLLSSTDITVKIISSLVKSKKILASLKNDEVYIACKKLGNFDGTKTEYTNIFDNDSHYNYCYNFFMKYFNKDVTIAPEDQMYKSFVEVNLFSALQNLGFNPSSDNESISINNSANLKYNNISFDKAPFVVSLTQTEEGVSIDVVNNVNRSKASTLINIVHSTSSAKVQKADESKYVNQFTITDDEKNTSKNTLIVVPQNANAFILIQGLIKSLFFIAEGSDFVHTRYCPVCGSALVSPDGGDYSCISCGSLYNIFSYEFKDIVWIKHFNTNKVITRKAKSDLSNIEGAISEVAVTDAQQNVRARTYTSISFTGKMCQSEQMIKDFYQDLKNYILRLKGTRSNVSWSFDNFFVGRNSTAKIAFRGKVMVLYLALPVEQYLNTKYFPKDFGHIKKYENTPMMVKVKSNRGLMFAKQLIDKAFEGIDLKKNFAPETYKFPKKSTAQLIKQNLAKKVTK